MRKLTKFLAVDCGGTRIKMGLVADRKLVAQHEIDTDCGDTVQSCLPKIAAHLEKICSDHSCSPSDCDGILLAIPVIVSPDLRTVTRCFGKFVDAIGFDFVDWAGGRLGLPLLLENDARAAAIAEWDCGAGRGVSNMAMVTLGTGIGTAVICEGKPLRGRSGLAGNLGGHTATHVGGEICSCGIDGCLEAQVATWALPGLLHKDPEFAGSALFDEPILDYETLFRHSAEGDRLAGKYTERALRGWAALLVNLVHGYDPERIVLGGGIMRQADSIIRPLQELLNRQATLSGGAVELVPAQIGVSAALLAAPWLFEKKGSFVRA